MKLRTWHFEWAVVLAVLATVNLVTKAPLREWIGALAVLLSFGHAAVGDRMAERQALMVKPDVSCFRWSGRFYVGKEGLWLVYFVLHQSYAALVGVFVFLCYPFWRKFWRRIHPLRLDQSQI